MRLWVLWLAALGVAGPPAGAAVKTPKRPVTNEYHGVRVVDEYQWLENGADPEVRRWSAAQNQQARTYLDGRANRRWIQRRLEQLMEAPSTNYFALTARRGLVFAMKSRPPAQQPMLVTLASLTNPASERVVLDLNLLDPSGGTSIDWFVPSPDGSLVAVSLSQGGSEMGTLFFYETASGRRREDSVPRVQGPTAGGSVAWKGDGSGVFYTRYPRPGERPEADLGFYQQVYFHRLGTPSGEDVYEIGREFPRIAEIELASSPDGRRVLATVSNGDGGEYAHYLREPDGRWRQVTRFEDEVTQARFGRDPLYIEAGKDDALYLLSYAGAPKGKVLRLPFKAANLGEATVVVPQGTNVIKSIHPSASGLGLVILEGGPSDFEFLDFFDGRIYGQPDRGVSSIQEVAVIEGDEIVYRLASFTEPGRWLRYNPSRDRTSAERLPLSSEAPADFGDVEVLRTTAISRDGTRVPLSIIQKKGTRLTGDHPTLLTGYGG
ncbi:MAG TPA: S9 family peptidase, partial [Methylomirabilota bacterium]|nr:S9 family peptidase [Methylomirabilota bacterium]